MPPSARSTERLPLEMPSIGAWATYGLGSINDNLPQFVVLGEPIDTCCGGVGAHGASYLGPEHNGGIAPQLWAGPMIPFQDGGRRVCMGKEMAMTEVKVTLALIARAGLEFELAPGQSVARFPNVTICARAPEIGRAHV